MQLQLFTTSVTLDSLVIFDMQGHARAWHWQPHLYAAVLRLLTAVSGSDEWDHSVVTGEK